MTTTAGAGPRVFISYSHEDADWLRKLRMHLEPYFPSDADLDVWADTLINSGANWHASINEAMEAAKVAVLLVSASFLASDFIRDSELPVLKQAWEAARTRIIWIPVSDSAYRKTWLNDVHAAIDPRRPLNKMPAPDQDSALVLIAEQINEAVNAPVEPARDPAVANAPRPHSKVAIANLSLLMLIALIATAFAAWVTPWWWVTLPIVAIGAAIANAAGPMLRQSPMPPLRASTRFAYLLLRSRYIAAFLAIVVVTQFWLFWCFGSVAITAPPGFAGLALRGTGISIDLPADVEVRRFLRYPRGRHIPVRLMAADEEVANLVLRPGRIERIAAADWYRGAALVRPASDMVIFVRGNPGYSIRILVGADKASLREVRSIPYQGHPFWVGRPLLSRLSPDLVAQWNREASQLDAYGASPLTPIDDLDTVRDASWIKIELLQKDGGVKGETELFKLTPSQQPGVPQVVVLKW